MISGINTGKGYYDQNLSYPLRRKDENLFKKAFGGLMSASFSTKRELYSKISSATGLALGTIKKYDLGMLREDKDFKYPLSNH